MRSLPFLGVGVNCHRESIPTPTIYIPHANWVRLDDLEAGHFDVEATRTLLQHYVTAGYKILYDISNTYAGLVVGHFRDLLPLVAEGLIDAFSLYNEPDGNHISAETYYSDLAAIRSNGCYCCPSGTYIVGPNASTWTGDGGAAKAWMDAFVALGGLALLDAFAVHPYTYEHGAATIASWVPDIRTYASGIPIIFTEWSENTKHYNQIHGASSWSALGQAADYTLACTSSDNVPILLYDGAYSVNKDGYEIEATVFSANTSSIQVVNSTAGMYVNGWLLFGSEHSDLRQVQSIIDSQHVQLTASVTTTKDESVVSSDHNQCLTYVEGSGWSAEGAGNTPLGAALNSALSTAGFVGVGG